MFPEKPRVQRVLALALPIIGGMVSQNVMNLVDTAMVGQLGKEALAAVGLASFANFFGQAFLTGLATGVQAMAARRLGEGREGEIAVPLNGSLALSVLMGVPLTIIIWNAAPYLFPYLVDDPLVVESGVPYWRARAFAITAVGMNFSFRGFWNGVNLSRLYMRTLVVMHVCNIAMNYVLIFGKLGLPALGAEGAGIGTAIATWLGAITYTFLGLKHARKGGFLKKRPSLSQLGVLLRLSTPMGLNQLAFSGGLTAMFWIIGRVGTAELAAANVLINIMLVAILPGLGFGMAAASLVGQALGKREPDDASQWAWDTAKVSAVAMGALGVPMILFPELVISIFVDESEAASVVAAGSLPLRLFGASVGFEGIRTTLQFSLNGAGDTRRTALVGVFTQWFLFLPTAYLVGPVLGFGLLGVWSAMIGQNLLNLLLFALLWKHGKWKDIAV